MPEDYVKATVQVGNNKITFEGPREFVEAQIAKYASIDISKPEDNIVGKRNADALQINEKTLVAEKCPANHMETVAVLAFALTQSGREEFTDAEMRKAYIRAGVRPPKVVAQALRDAKNKADFIEPGSKKGTYRLSPHGDRTVRFDLPRPE